MTGAINGAGTTEVLGTKAILIAHGTTIGVDTVLQSGRVALAASVAVTNAADHTWDLDASTDSVATLSGGTGATFTNEGTFEGTGAGTDNISSAFTNMADVQLSAGKMTFIDALTNNGTMTATGASLLIDKTLAGTGALDIGNLGTVTLDDGSGAGTLLDFLTSTGLLDLQKPLSFDGTIDGFVQENTIDLLNTTETGFSFSGGVLTVTKGTTTAASLNFSGSYTTSSFNLTSDGHGGTFITYT